MTSSWLRPVLWLWVPLLGIRPLPAQDAPPAGYSWHVVAELRARLLVPDGWTFRASSRSDTLIYTMAAPPAASQGALEQQMTIRVLRHLPHGQAAARAQQHVLDGLIHGVVTRPLTPAAAPGFLMFVGSALIDSGTSRARMEAFGGIANPRTNTLYTLTLRCSAADWEGPCRVGRLLFTRLDLDEAL